MAGSSRTPSRKCSRLVAKTNENHLETPVPRVNMLIVNLFPHMITILASVRVFHLKYFCFTRARVSKACLFYSLSSKKPPATGTPTPIYLRHNNICECKDCHDYKCPYFHQSLSTLIRFSDNLSFKLVTSPVILPIIFTALAGLISPSLLIGVGPKKIQKALPLGQYPKSPS